MIGNPEYRSAHADDSRFIAEMIDISSDGVALIEWTEAQHVADGRTALDVGAEIYASKEGVGLQGWDVIELSHE
jgi:hypothetical protein